MKTMKTANGSSYQVPAEQLEPIQCPTDMAWLRDVLKVIRPHLPPLPHECHSNCISPRIAQQSGLKAYRPDISVNDPKQRRTGNEVQDWCRGEALKLWSTEERRYVPELHAMSNGKRTRLVSAPTNNFSAVNAM